MYEILLCVERVTAVAGNETRMEGKVHLSRQRVSLRLVFVIFTTAHRGKQKKNIK
jgi:hypothetical protein